MSSFVLEKLKLILNSFAVGKFESSICVMKDVQYSRDIGFLDLLRVETISVVCTFLSKASKGNGQNKEDTHNFITTLEIFCNQLQKLLEKLRSLPPSVSCMEAEFAVLYNFGYCKLVKSCVLKGPPEAPSILVQSVQHSLTRVRFILGFDSEVQTATPRTDKSLDQVFSALLVLARSLQPFDNQALFQQIQLQLCLTALMIQVTKRSASCDEFPLSTLQLDRFNKKVVMKHGFVVMPSLQFSLLKSQNNDSDVFEDEHLPTMACVASLVTAVLAFEGKSWEACKKNALCVSFSSWKPLSSLLAGHSLLESGHYLEAVELLHRFLEGYSALISPKVESSIYNILAECYSQQGFRHLAIKMLCHSLKVNPNDNSSLHALASQYRHLQQTEAELDCLRLFVKVLRQQMEKNTLLDCLPLFEDVLLDIVSRSRDLSLGQGLYYLASRLAQLSRCDEAYECYLDLIQMYNGNMHKPSCGDPVPDLLTICREAAEMLLLGNKHKECLSLCNKVLMSVDTVSLCGGSDQDDVFLGAHTPEKGVAKASQEMKTKCTRKRQLTGYSQDREQEEEKELAWKTVKNRALLLACRANALVVDGDCAAAVRDLTRAVDELLECSRRGGMEEFPRLASPRHKRPRQDPDQKQAGDERETVSLVRDAASQFVFVLCRLATFNSQHHLSPTGGNIILVHGQIPVTDDWNTLNCSLCVQLADALSRQKVDRQALHFARLAVQLSPEDESALYFLCLILDRLGRGVEGYQQWLQKRALPHHTGSVRVHGLLEERQEQLRCVACDDGQTSRRLGSVTDTEKLQLDVTCIQTLLRVRSGGRQNRTEQWTLDLTLKKAKSAGDIEMFF